MINIVLMANKVYKKRINGRDYLYERLWSKRVGDKIITKDKCLGAVHPVTNKIGRLPAKRISHYRSEYEGMFPISSIRDEMKEKDGITVSETTIRNFFKDAGSLRMPMTTETRRAAKAEDVEKKARAEARVERESQHRFNILMEEKRLTTKQIVAIGKGEGLNKKMIDAAWKKRS